MVPRIYGEYVICPQLLEDRTPITGRVSLPEAFDQDQGNSALRSLGVTAQWSGETLHLCTANGRSAGFLPPLSAYSVPPIQRAGNATGVERQISEPQTPTLAQAIRPAPPAPPPVVELVTLTHLQPAKGQEMAQGLCGALGDCSVVLIPGQPVLAVRGASEAVSGVIRLLTVADVPQRSYRLRATLFEVEHSAGQVLGIEGQLGTSVFGSVAPTTEGAIRLGLDYAGATIAIRAQEDEGRATVLSRPELRLSDGQPATFASSVEVPTVSQIIFDDAGRQTQGIEYREAGLILNVTLRAAGSSVELDLGQELSAFAQQRSAVAGNPSKTKRSLRSTFNLPIGEPVVIGGLIRDTTDQGEGRLPFLGWPVRRNDQTSRTQVFLLVQVDQLAQPAAGGQATSEERPKGEPEGDGTPPALTLDVASDSATVPAKLE